MLTGCYWDQNYCISDCFPQPPIYWDLWSISFRIKEILLFLILALSIIMVTVYFKHNNYNEHQNVGTAALYDV